MLAVSGSIFEKDTIGIFQRKDLFDPILAEISKACEFLLWKDPNSHSPSTKLTINTLNKLKTQFENQDEIVQQKVEKAVLSGRFDKKKFELPNTVVIGEDGGIYLLLNNLGDNKEVIKEIASDDYLKDKLQTKGEKQQITIGKGGFGTVRFALSLFDAKSKPGEVICIKKTKSIKGSETPCAQIIDVTLRDYFTNNIADIIYAPNVFDMALVTQDENSKHRKGYLMMEVLPQNTATKVFANPNYQKWEYQKPYLLDVFDKTQKLLEQNVAMTDLKPDNSLYNTDIRKATIIDLGGIVKIDKEEKTKFNIRKYSFQHTKEFSALELQQDKGIIDIEKALSFACGRIIEDITKVTDIDQGQVKVLVNSLIQQTPKNRSSIKDAIKGVKKIGDDSYKENVIFVHYISKIKERLENNKSSISINEDIKKTEDLYIELYTTELNPYRYSNLETDILFSKIDDFWGGQKEVMLLLGVAGAGKSIALQLKFMEAVKNWKPSDPLPIYFNLASNIDLVKVIDSLNNELGTNLKLNDIQNAHLYIDSFDEGLGIATNRETLIREYIEKLGKSKILISCRTDYLPNDNDHNWFMPKSKQLEVCYITPINYSSHQNLEEYVRKYVNHSSTTHNTEYYLDRIKQLKIEQIIDTGFMFEIVMQSVPSITKEHVSKQDIYDEYVKTKQSKKIQKLTGEQKERAVELLPNFNASTQDLNQLLKELGKYIAIRLHLQNKFGIKGDDELFKALGYEDSTLFKQQALYHILKLLPLKVEAKASVSKVKVKQEVEIRFIHGIIKNYYLFEAIKDEIDRSGKSKILSSRSIIKDAELIKLIADSIIYGDNLKCFLRKAIDTTKYDKSEEAVLLAANSITLLVAAKHSFSGEDLSNISIKGANVRNGIFHDTDFTNANFTKVNLFNAKLMGTKFIHTIMKDLELDIYPNLIGHTKEITAVRYSPDGKTIATASYDGTIKVWDATTSNLIETICEHAGMVMSVAFSPDSKIIASASSDQTVKLHTKLKMSSGGFVGIVTSLVGHASVVTSVTFSLNGERVVSGSYDRTVKLWDVTGTLIKTISTDHTDAIVCVAFSPDSIASASYDRTVKLWNSSTYNLIKTLFGHDDMVLSVAFSLDGDIATASKDKTVKLWYRGTYNLKNTLFGHTDSINSVAFSLDGETIATASEDETVALWGNTTGKLKERLRADGRVTSISFDPNKNVIAIACNGVDGSDIKLCVINSTLLQISSDGHTKWIRSVVFSPDNKTIATASEDNTIKLWDSTTGEFLNALWHVDWVTDVVFSRDSETIASGSYDRTVRIWHKNSKSKWLLIREISDVETHLQCDDMIVRDVIGLSKQNQKVFEQKKIKVKNNITIYTETKETINDSTSLIAAEEISHALLKEKLDIAAEQKTLKLVKVESKFKEKSIKVENDIYVVGIKYDNPLLNNPMLLMKLASNLNINLNKAVDASDYLTNLFGSKNFNYICNSDQNLLQELLGNYCEY